MPEPKQKHTWRWIAVAAVAIIFFVVVIVLFVTREKSVEWKILDTYEQYIEDPNFGTVYEIVYVVNTYPELKVFSEYANDQIVSYAQELELETDIVKVSCYDSEEALEMSEDPGLVSYLFLNNYEEN